MKKKLLATAITAVAASVSGTAFAVTYETSEDVPTNAGTPVVASGGPSVIANDVWLTLAAGDVEGNDPIAIRLPAGFNFAAGTTPTVTVDEALTLRLRDELGDPALAGFVTLSDTDGDGGMDRAEVAASNTSATNDSVTFSNIEVVYSSTSTKVGDKSATVVVGGTAGTVTLAEVISTLVEPVTVAKTVALQNDDATNADVKAAVVYLTVPEGAEAGETIVLTLDPELEFATGTTTVGLTRLTPDAPALNAVQSGTGVLTITLPADFEEDAQYLVSIDQLDVNKATKATDVGGKFSGTAGISGSIDLVELAASRVEAEVDEDIDLEDYEVVRGSNTGTAVAPVTISELFGDDLDGTITLKAPTGVSFVDPAPTGGSIVVDNGGFTLAAAVTSKSVMTLTPTDAGDTASAAEISDILITVASTYAQDTVTLSVTNGSETDLVETSLVVANVVDAGGVEIERVDDDPASVGSDSAGVKASMTLTEETYGSLRAGTLSDITITAPEGVTIDSATASGLGGAGEITLDSANGVVQFGDQSVVFVVATESTTASEFDIEVEFTLDDVAVGTDIEFTVSGAAGAEGSVVLATVENTVDVEVVGVTPDIEPGTASAKAFATLSIEENFIGALDEAGTFFRIIAPLGVTLNQALIDTLNTVPGANVADLTVTTTNTVNDTLLVELVDQSATADVMEITLAGNLSSTIGNLSGLVPFQIADGDAAGEDETGIVEGSFNLVYAGSVDALEIASDSATVLSGFSASVAFEGGLADYTVDVDDSNVATARVDGSNVIIVGRSAGTATVTVEDALGNTDTLAVTVTAVDQGELTELENVLAHDGSETTATLFAGASTDGGETFGDEFTTGDEVTILAAVNPDEEHIGEEGALFIVVRTITPAGEVWLYQDADGVWQNWDTRIASLEPAAEVDALEETHVLQVFEGRLAAGSHRVFVGYIAGDGAMIYNGNGMHVNVTAE